MAKSAGMTLGVNLALNTQGLAADADKAVATISKLGKSIDKTGVGAIAAGTAIGNLAAGAVTSLISRLMNLSATVKNLVAAQFTAVDAQAKLGDSFGLSQGQIAAFTLAAEKSGSTIEAMRPALQKMQKTIADAAAGGAKAIESLGEAGLTADDFVGKDAIESLRMVSRGLLSIESTARRARAAQELFGEGAVRGGSFLLNASEALADATEKTLRYGTALSGIDAARLEVANDAMRDLREASRGLFTTFAVELAPIVMAFSDWMANDFPAGFRSAIGGMIADVKTLADRVAAVFERVKTAANFLREGAVDRGVASVGKFAGGAISLMPFLGSFGESIEASSARLLQDANQRLSDELTRHEQRLAAPTFFTSFFDRAQKSSDMFAAKIEENRRQLRELNAAANLIGPSADEVTKKSTGDKMQSIQRLAAGLTAGSSGAANIINQNSDRMQQQMLQLEQDQRRIAADSREELRAIRRRLFEAPVNDGLPVGLSVLRF